MKIVASLLIVLALVVGIVPQFTDCASDGRMLTLADGRTIPMKCHWTAKGELALAVPLLATGSVMAASRRKETWRSLSLIGTVLGVLIILLPTSLIGVCGNPDMICNSVMKPVLILAGSVVTAVGLIGLVASFVRRDTVE
jgi:hypothetical protein